MSRIESSRPAIPAEIPPFDYDPRTRLVFGAGTIRKLGEHVCKLGGQRVLLVTDAGLKQAGHEDVALEVLAEAGVSAVVYDDVQANPTSDDIDAGAEFARRHEIDLLIGLGGGSSMDCAKGINFVITNGGKIEDYWGIGKASKPMLPLICVPTTAGTGSEAQSFAVIAHPTTHLKMACGDKKAAARVAILDPDLTLSMPESVTAATGVDAISHALETYVTTRRTPVSQIFSRQAWQLLSTAFPGVLLAPGHQTARGAMLLGSHLAGAAIENSMLGATHAAANPLTAHYDLTHGVAIGLMLPHVIRFNASVAAAHYGELAADAGLCQADDPAAAELLAAFVKRLVARSGGPTTLAECGIDAKLIPTLAAEATEQWTGKFNPRPAAAPEFEELYRCALRLRQTGRTGCFLSAVVLAALAAGCSGSSPAPTPGGSTTGPSIATADPGSTSGASSPDTPVSAPSATSSPESSSGPAENDEAVLAVADVAGESAAGNAPPAGAGRTARSDDWPDFRNGTDLRGIAGSTLPDKLELLWELETHDGVTSTAAIADGRIYVAELSGNVRCLDLHSGQEYWHYRTIESEDPQEFAPGFNAPVTLSATAVFVGDEDGAFHALDRATGARLWPPIETHGEIKGGATILPPDPQTGVPRVMFGSHDGKLYCLNAATGEQLWAFDTMGMVNGSQAIDRQYTFVSGCDRPFLRVVDVETGEQHVELPLDESLMIASPALVGSVLYFGTSDGEVVALDWQAAERVWTYSSPKRQQQIHSSPAVTDDLVLIGSQDKRLHAIDRQTGEAAWTFETRGPIDSSPVVVGERIFFGSADRNVYGVSFSGEEVWKHNTGHRVSASPAVGEGHLVIGGEGPGGPILCFGAMR